MKGSPAKCYCDKCELRRLELMNKRRMKVRYKDYKIRSLEIDFVSDEDGLSGYSATCYTKDGIVLVFSKRKQTVMVMTANGRAYEKRIPSLIRKYNLRKAVKEFTEEVMAQNGASFSPEANTLIKRNKGK